MARTPEATDCPNRSNASADPAAPPPWKRVWAPPAVMPAAEPNRTVTAPASLTAPTFSPGTPTARSKKVSPSKSPAASEKPKLSFVSGLSWTNNGPPVRPPAEP